MVKIRTQLRNTTEEMNKLMKQADRMNQRMETLMLTYLHLSKKIDKSIESYVKSIAIREG